jgi:hypothetical protein
MRITNASLPLNGILPISAIFDTPGVLARSGRLLQAAHRRWYPAKVYTSYPKRIVLPDLFWPTVNGKSMHIFDSFISQLATFLDANLTTFNANASFNAYTNTSEGPASYIGSTYSNITNVDQYRDLGLPFREQYIAKFGRAPYWNPQTRARWNRAATLPISSYTTAIERTEMFQSWFREIITPTCESTLVLYPMGVGTEDYRDIYTTAPGGIFAAGLP